MQTLKYVDFISKKPEIYINGEPRFYSWIGVTFSIVMSVTFLSILSYFLTELTSRKNFQIYENNLKDIFPVLDYSLYPIAAGLFYINGSSIPTNMYEIQFGRADFILDKSSEIIYKFFFSNQSNLCEENKNINPYFNFTKNMFCFPPKFNKTLYGKIGNFDTGYSVFVLNIFKCKNGTFYDEFGKFHNNTNCADQSIIDKELSLAHMYIEYIDTSLNHLNSQPFKSQKTGNTYPLSSSLYRDIFLKFQILEYNSDSGYLFEEIANYKSFKFSTSETTVNIRTYNSGLFASVRLALIDNKILYTRKYMKLQVALASIGGFVKFLLITAQTLVQYLTEKSYYLFLMNNLFTFEKQTYTPKINNLMYNTDNDMTMKKTIRNNLRTVKGQSFSNNNITNDIENKFHNVQKSISINSIITRKFKINILTKNDNGDNFFKIWDLMCIFLRRKNKTVQRLKKFPKGNIMYTEFECYSKYEF